MEERIPGDYRYVPILWAQESALFKQRRRKHEIFCGICGESGRIFKLAGDNITILIVRDIIIDTSGCEEGKRCLDFDCPLNKTTFESLCKGLGFTLKKMNKIKERVVNHQTMDMNKNPDGGLNDFSDFIKAHPHGGFLLKK